MIEFAMDHHHDKKKLWMNLQKVKVVAGKLLQHFAKVEEDCGPRQSFWKAMEVVAALPLDARQPKATSSTPQCLLAPR